MDGKTRFSFFPNMQIKDSRYRTTNLIHDLLYLLLPTAGYSSIKFWPVLQEWFLWTMEGQANGMSSTVLWLNGLQTNNHEWNLNLLNAMR